MFQLPNFRTITSPEDRCCILYPFGDHTNFVMSIPRSGFHYFKFMMETLTYRPCAPIAYFYPKNEPFAYHIHDLPQNTYDYKHDINSFFCIDASILPGTNLPTTTIKKLIFIHREDVVAGIYSWFKFNEIRKDKENWEITEHNIIRLTQIYKQLREKWLYISGNVDSYIITYEKLVAEPIETLKNTTELFGLSFNEHYAKIVVHVCTKKRLRMITSEKRAVPIEPDYEILREEFRDQYTDIIMNIIA